MFHHHFSSTPTESIPSFSREFCRHLLTSQHRLSCFYLHHLSLPLSQLPLLFSVPGDDPLKDSTSILYRWAILSFINRLTHPPTFSNPLVPLDFSPVHPTFRNPETLIQYARGSPDLLLELVAHFSVRIIQLCSFFAFKCCLEFHERLFPQPFNSSQFNWSLSFPFPASSFIVRFPDDSFQFALPNSHVI
jgi:hypothetical protein